MGSWCRAKARLRRYSRREPQATPLYQIVSSCLREFSVSWEELFERQYGALREVVTRALESYLRCGILAHGCARLQCRECSHSELLAFSCKRRSLCPSCDAKRAVIFAENLVEQVLKPHPHSQVVFSKVDRITKHIRDLSSSANHANLLS